MNQENPIVIEGTFSDKDCTEKSIVSSLRIRGICEGSAEARLTRLLRRGKFDEAEKFAKLSRLSLEEVHQAKAAWLMEQLSPWTVQKDKQNDDKSKEDLFEDLKKTLLAMEDLEYMVRCSVTAAMPSLKLTRELLVLARTVIQNNMGK